MDQGWELRLDEEHSVHDVAALLKEFLRDMPDPLLTRELYTAFINTMCEDKTHTAYTHAHKNNSLDWLAEGSI